MYIPGSELPTNTIKTEPPRIIMRTPQNSSYSHCIPPAPAMNIFFLWFEDFNF